MDPYRDNFKVEVDKKFTQLFANVNHLMEDIDELKRNKSVSSIKRNIITWFSRLDWEDAWMFMLYLVAIGLLVWTSIAIYMSSISDSIPDSCHFRKDEDKWLLYVEVDWQADKTYSEFQTVEEVKEAAKLNGCPNLEQ